MNLPEVLLSLTDSHTTVLLFIAMFGDDNMSKSANTQQIIILYL